MSNTLPSALIASLFTGFRNNKPLSTPLSSHFSAIFIGSSIVASAIYTFATTEEKNIEIKEKYKFNNQVLDWLINGNVDRSVYFVARKQKPIFKLNESKNLKLIKDFGGYQFYKRELK